MLARETGGEAFFPANKRDLQTAYARILDELGSRYTIGYESTNAKTDGHFRKVEVRLTTAQGKIAHVRTRSGYWRRIGDSDCP
jgi:Ca-activated chloride channel family protein